MARMTGDVDQDIDPVVAYPLRDRSIVEKLFDDLGPRYAKRNGGYLRILKTGFRKGDNAPLALVSLMDRLEQAAAPAQEKKSKSEEKKAAKTA